METTIVYRDYKMEATIVYWGYIGIMENKIENTIAYWGYIGIMGLASHPHLSNPLLPIEI